MFRTPPRFGAVAPLTLLIAALCPTSVHAQAWGSSSGYNALVTELGGSPPATEYDELSLIAAADTTWRYRKGTSEASSPTDAWRGVAFSEDGSWSTGQTPIGYGNSGMNTVLNDMQGNYSTVYLRKTFTVTSGAVPARLVVRVYVDDGAIVWLNGTEVARLHVGAGFKAFDATASANREPSWEDVSIPAGGSLLNVGTNVLAVHALNRNKNGLGANDFSIDAELLSPALRVTHVEANPSGTRNYLPQTSPDPSPPAGFGFAGSGILAGQTLHTQSVAGGETFSQSSHSYNVANRWYSTNSLSPGIGLVDNFDASGWLGGDFLQNASASAPSVENNIAQNHSWIATLSNGTAAELNEIIRRQDYAINRDGYLAAIGLNNGSGNSVPPVFGSAYNVIAVGRTDGGHSRNGTIDSGIDGPGRVKPDIVGNDSATSYSTPQVASAACFLMAHANTRGWSKPFTSHVMKAILMAGATKSEFQNGSYTWSRTTTQPLDAVYGSGEYNVQHSYHILDAGEQDPAASSANYGWDQHSLGASGSATYTLVLDSDIAELSCVVSWNRTVDQATWLGDASFSDTVADMSLQLTDGTGATVCDSSDSAVDNVEHVYQRGLKAGTYLLTVDTDVAVDYAIAWRADTGALPMISMTEGTTAGDADFTFENLAIGKEYTLQSSTDLENWAGEHTFTATADTASHTVAGGLSPLRKFYKVTWDPVN